MNLYQRAIKRRLMKIRFLFFVARLLGVPIDVHSSYFMASRPGPDEAEIARLRLEGLTGRPFQVAQGWIPK